ncbi:MAG: tetratricopeptide repeat protein [Gemmatimonadota bacterium]|nr:tetratricopeptide repeat protein [Gemmatimonadota bacterium]
MGGYRALSEDVVGDVADVVRDASERDAEGRPEEAAVLYERAFSESLASGAELPSFLVGRLAVLYRRLGRFEDEIYLLERYRDSRTDDEMQARYRARLAKAHSLAAQHRMSDSVALASVRASTQRSLGKRRRSRGQQRVSGAVEPQAQQA